MSGGISSGVCWQDLVWLSGEAGRQWLEAYREPSLVALERLGNEALESLRRGQLDEGRRLLEELAAGLAAQRDLPASVRHVHDRWYYGILAYHEYAAGKPREAEQCLQAAYEAVCAAIGESPFLVLLANHCQEFRLHQARIARSRNHWPDVRRYIREAERMIDGGAPLCVLEDGREIHFADMQVFCESLPRPADEPPYLANLFDRERHRQLFTSFVETIYMMPSYAVVY